MFTSIALSLIVGGIGIFILMRLMGKKAISDLTPFDIIYTLVLGGIVEEAIYDDQVSVLHQLFAVVVWGVFIYLIELALQKTERISNLIQGEPAVLISDGKLNMKELNNNHLDMEQLRTVLRQSNCFSLKEVKYAVLEVNGGVSVIRYKDIEAAEQPTFLLVEEGTIKNHILDTIAKDEEWLFSVLESEGYTNVDEIIYCEWSPDGGIYVITTDETINKKIRLDG